MDAYKPESQEQMPLQHRSNASLDPLKLTTYTTLFEAPSIL